jgi:hypothetical protein
MLDDVEKKKGIFTVYPRIDRETLRFCSSIMSSSEVRDMAEYGEWNRKGATLSDVTA